MVDPVWKGKIHRWKSQIHCSKYTLIEKYNVFVIVYMTMDKTTVTAKGQIVIPARLRQKFDIRQGTQVSIFERNGEIIVRPITDEYIEQHMGMTRTSM